MSDNNLPREAAHFKQHPWIIRPDVPDEIYTNRTEFLDYFYKAALDAANRRFLAVLSLEASSSWGWGFRWPSLPTLAPLRWV